MKDANILSHNLELPLSEIYVIRTNAVIRTI
jgi:hypothetical protein